MYIRLIRNKPQGNAITGRLVIDGRWFCNTLERKGYEILALCYHVAVTMSPKFKRLLPLVTGVPRSIFQDGVELSSTETTTPHNAPQPPHNATQPPHHAPQPPHHAPQPLHNAPQPPHHATPSALRTGIRFHRGTKPEHSTGCILVLADNKNDNTDNLRPNQIAPHSPTRLIGDPAYPLGALGEYSSPRQEVDCRGMLSKLSSNKPNIGCRSAAEVENQLTQLLLKTQNDHEEIILEVIDYRPDTDAGYDTACPIELQQHKIDERRAAKRLSQLFREFASDTQRPTT